MMKMSAVINELRSEAEKMTKEVLTAKEVRSSSLVIFILLLFF